MTAITAARAAVPQPLSTASDAAMRELRETELHRHPEPPSGAEVHADGVFHEVQQGDGLYAIAREYSQKYHMDISWEDVRAANVAATANGLQPGERLAIPRLEARFDAMIAGTNPDLRVAGGEVRHVVGAGDTLSTIARQYGESEGIRVSWQKLYAANRDVIGADPNVIRAGQALRIPGVTNDSPRASLPTLSELDQRVVVTRTGLVQHEAGGIETVDVMRYRADGSHAQWVGGSVDDAITAAKAAAGTSSGRSNVVVVAQARDGAYWMVPVRGIEAGGLDHTDTTLSLAFRADERAVAAIVEKRHDGSVTVRRTGQ